MKILTMSGLALAISASAASAQSTEYLSYGASYTSFGADDASFDVMVAGASIDYRFNQFVLNGGIGLARLSDDDEEESISGISGRAGYFLLPNAVVYGGVNSANFSDSDGFDSYNLGGEYSFDDITVGLNYEDSNDSDINGVTTLYMSYQFNNDLEGAFAMSEADGETFTQLGFMFDDDQRKAQGILAEDGEFIIYALDGSFDFGTGLRALGNLSRIEDSDLTINQVVVGAGYEVSDDFWLDLTVGRVSSTEGEDIDVIGLEFSFETGRQTLLIDRSETSLVRALGAFGTANGANSF